MRNFNLLNRFWKLGWLSTLVAIASLASAPEAKAQGVDQWTFKVQTEEHKRPFDYKQSKLNPIAKVVVNYKKTKENKEPEIYETFWCRDGKPIGLERSNPYIVPRGDLVHIQVEEKNYSDQENKAIAYALMRLGVVTHHHFNATIAITLPASTFPEICEEMRARTCEDYIEDPAKASDPGVLFHLRSEPSGLTQELIFKTKRN